jgi:hypothetical protein
LADADSSFVTIENIRVHYKLFRYRPPLPTVIAAPGSGKGRKLALAAVEEADTDADDSATDSKRPPAAAGASALDSVGSAVPTGSASSSLVAASPIVFPVLASPPATVTRETAGAAEAAAAAAAGIVGTPGVALATVGDSKQSAVGKRNSPTAANASAAAALGASPVAVLSDMPARVEIPIVLLHGFGGSVHSFRRIWKTVCANATTILAFDRFVAVSVCVLPCCLLTAFVRAHVHLIDRAPD